MRGSLGWRLGGFVLFLLLSPGLSQAMGHGHLTILGADRHKAEFEVEVAETPEEHRTGLMNRPSLPADHGMLFDFGAPQTIAMWMKNTLIPLDMIFVDEKGVIAGIAQRTVPFSLAVIPSPGPVRAVIEINGGAAERLGIRPGDRVSCPPLFP